MKVFIFVLALWCQKEVSGQTYSPWDENFLSKEIKIDRCILTHDRKCYTLITGRLLNHNKASSTCQNLGGNLANLQSQTHMEEVMARVRDYISGNTVFLRLGMTLDLQTGKILLRDGTKGPNLKWYPWNPLTKGFAGWTEVILAVDPDAASAYQYLFNSPPAPVYSFNALCEV